MKSMFDIGFRKPFMPLPLAGSMPIPTRKLGEDPGWDTGWDSGEIYTSFDEGPAAQDVPDLYTSYDQGPASSPVPGLVTWQDLIQDSASSGDWGKLAQDLIKGAGAGFGSYQQAQAKFNTERAKAGLPAVPLATAAASAPSISPNVIFLVGGLAVAVLAAVALS